LLAALQCAILSVTNTVMHCAERGRERGIRMLEPATKTDHK